VETARHDGRDELRRHALHDFVAGRDGDEELLAGSAGDLRRDEGRRKDRDARMGQHAEGVPFAAGENRLGIDESGPGLGEPRAAAQHRRRTAPACLLLLHQRERLSAGRRVAGDQRRAQRLQGHALRPIHHFRREVFEFEVCDECSELPTERHGGSPPTLSSSASDVARQENLT
jgi:hypothetical protein